MRTPFLLQRAGAVAGALAAVLVAVAPAHAAFAGRNGLLAYASDGRLVVRKPNGSQARVIRMAVPVNTPAYSPQGRRIAFTGANRVWVMGADGSSLRALTDGTQPVSEPAWSPDGAAVAFTEGLPGATHIAVIDADGHNARRLTWRPGEDRSPAWSVGNQIAFVRRTARGDDLYVTDPSGQSSRRLTHARADEESPAWSPDGRRLAFSAGRVGRRTIAIIPAPGGKAKAVTTDAADAAAPVWSPDGRRLAITVRDRRARRVAVIRASGGRPTVVSHGSGDAGPPDWQPTGVDPVIAAAGDIACDPAGPQYNGGLGVPGVCQQAGTSDILLRMDLAAALVVGDSQYADGRADAWSAFDGSWGRLKPLLRPVPGNHEYRDAGAAGYLDYFNGPGVAYGKAGSRSFGIYSFDVGSWHIIALNSACANPPDQTGGIECGPGSPQETWLRQDLAAHPAACTLAFFHHPLWSSGIVGEQTQVLALWQDLYNAGADVVINGHDHAYERFTPQEPGGAPDPLRGIRTFVVGTGGRSVQNSVWTAPNSELRQKSFGVLALTLGEGNYAWRFMSEAGDTFTDSGTGSCH